MDDMNILISNDDGIFAPGIKKLAYLLSKIKDADIYVCAPDRERSCVGHGLTLFDDLYLYDQPAEDFGPAVVWAKSCSGTPGDCVRLALSVLGMKGIKIDLVCAGINNGGNTGSDINYSGTFAACREAAIDGFPAIAFSSTRGLDYLDNFDLIVPEIYSRFAGKIPAGYVLNVNAPNIPWADIKGYRSASLAQLRYPPRYTLVDRTGEDEMPPEDTETFAFASFAMEVVNAAEDADTVLVKDGWVTVSLIPLLQDTAETKAFTERMLSGAENAAEAQS